MRQSTMSIAVQLCFIMSFVFSSCVKEIDEFQPSETQQSNSITSMDQLVVPDNFHYDSDKKVNLNIQILDANDAPVQGVRVHIMDKTPDEEGTIFYTGGTDQNGYLTGEAKLPANLTDVIIHTGYSGVMDDVIASVNGNNLSCTIGGSNPQCVSGDNNRTGAGKVNAGTSSFRTAAVPPITTMGTWGSTGIPNYLYMPHDVVSTGLTQRINNTLPEKQKVTVLNPSFLTSTAINVIELDKTANVFVTFFHESSNAKNTLAYYVYNKNTPPTSTSNIPFIKVVFPNVSYQGSGGGLLTGRRVNLGTFNANDVISFVLLTASFNTPNVTNGTAQFYCNDALNPEGAANLKRHCVTLWDIAESKMVIGFEETLRSAAKCDHDFNDAIAIVSTVPSIAVNTANYAKTKNTTDSDGDGVIDVLDEFPNNANMAFTNTYPTADPNVYGHLAFEDLWPARGDYDLNDLIVGYRFQEFKNAANNIVRIDGKFFVNAAGGSYKHGFGFMLPIAQTAVQSVTGSVINENYISLNGKGLENGQSKSVIIAFDNSHKTINQPVGYFINTQQGAPPSAGDSIAVTVNFTAPQTSASIGVPPYNPFIISNMRRGYEIHLADMPPTDLVNTSLFNTLQDSTNIASGRYYKTKNNIPWAVNIPGSYDTVLEKNKIIEAYLHFPDWAQSGGTMYNDWYADKPGYRDPTKIFTY